MGRTKPAGRNTELAEFARNDYILSEGSRDDPGTEEKAIAV